MRYVEMVTRCKPLLYTAGTLSDADITLLILEGYKVLRIFNIRQHTQSKKIKGTDRISRHIV